MMREGTWWLYSATDPNWKAHGSGYVGMFMPLDQCAPAKDEFERLQSLFGEAPDDLEFGYMKD